MNIEQLVNHYRHEAERTADQCATRTGGTSELSRQNFMLGAYRSIVRELLSEMDEPTRHRLALKVAAWQDYLEARERAA